MKRTVEFKHWSPDRALRDLVDDLILRLDPLIAGVDPDTVFFRVVIEENARRKLYHVSTSLDVPGRSLATQAERHDPVEASTTSSPVNTPWRILMVIQFIDANASVPVYLNPAFVVAVRPDPAEPDTLSLVKVQDGETIRVRGEHREVANKLTAMAGVGR